MKKITYFFIIIFTFSLIRCKKHTTVNQKELNTNWQFKNTDEKQWKTATVPGTVHTDLLTNKDIKDPFYRLNEHDVQWVDKKDWEYKTNFIISEEEFSKDQLELEFKGLDTYAKIFLNDTLLLKTDNMFLRHRVNIKPFVKLKTNELKIILESPIKKGIEKHDAIDYNIIVSNNDLSEIGKVEGNKKVSIFSRKAGYHFGWDWGPRLVTSGIWRPVILRSWDSFKIEDVFIQQKKIDTIANLNAHIELSTTKEIEKSTIEVFVNNILVKKEEQNLISGINKITIPFNIENPELWWPNGMGKQHLYNVNIKVIANKHSDQFSHKIGLRTVELITEKDTIGSSFYFKVNGKATFMKGANYIPQDIFLSRVKKSNYEHILQSAKDANMNMIRVWGGGVYEHEDFYKLCDEKGLLVWQDFMFACAMYPGDAKFLESVKQEAIDNVKRLRNHTSIALWCGNNEVLSAWENWGWKKQTKEKQSEEAANTVWKAYTDIFHEILPEVVNEYDSDRRYWASSPSSKLGVPESHTDGDAHYWGVWWGKEPFDNYNVKIPRFMSEFGFQSFPELATVNKYTLPEDHDIFSEVMKSHQRSSIGNGTIEEYMLRHYKKPKDFESFLYVSHLLQAYGISTGIEAHRKNRDRCMGSLYWQINDCWPVASWSSIDYFGKWKALHYGVKKSFKKTIVSFDKQEKSIEIIVATDSLNDIHSKLEISLFDFEGNELKKWKKDVRVTANTSKTYITLSEEEINMFKNQFKSSFLQAKLVSENTIIDDKQFFFVPFKELKLPTLELVYDVKENDDYYTVTIKNKKLAIGVFASGNFDENFSDNYFNMLPNSEKSIQINKGKMNTIDDFKKKLKIISLVDSYKKEK